MQRIFDTRYREAVRLRDGAEVFISILGPEHRGALAAGFEGLSKESRFRRFLSPKSSLSEAELSYFTDIDGETHFALAAGHRRSDGSAAGLGTARFIRRPDDPDSAELAVVVVDEWQGRGLGRILLDRLVAAARERGIERLIGTVVATNRPMIHLLATAPGAQLQWTGGFIEAVLDLDSDDRVRPFSAEGPATPPPTSPIRGGLLPLIPGPHRATGMAGPSPFKSQT